MRLDIFTNNLMFKYFLSAFLVLLLASCTPKEPTAQDIVDLAIAAAGGAQIAEASIHFKFRDYYYRAMRNNGLRTLERCTDKECLVQQDVVGNDGAFVRFRESTPITTPDSMKSRYANSVNSVHYFSVLPYGLNDTAVSKSLVEEATVQGAPYYKIKVSFAQENGGTDFQDEYLYWIHQKNYTVDYLAYNYQASEGGTRFREAYNERFIDGIRFVDYRNYKPDTQYPPLVKLDSLFEKNKLHLLSTIELEQVNVRLCPDC